MEIIALGVLICKRARRLYRLDLPSYQATPTTMTTVETGEGQTQTSVKTDSDVEEVQQRAPCYNYIGWLRHVGAHLFWQDSRTAFI